MRSFQDRTVRVNRLEIALEMPATFKDMEDFLIRLKRHAALSGDQYIPGDYFRLRIDDNELVAYRESVVGDGPNYRGNKEEF